MDMSELTAVERDLLGFALERLEEYMVGRSNEFEDEEFTALARLQGRLDGTTGGTEDSTRMTEWLD